MLYQSKGTVSVSVIYFLCEYSESVRYSHEYKTVPNGTVIAVRRENAFWHYRIQWVNGGVKVNYLTYNYVRSTALTLYMRVLIIARFT